MGSTFSPAQATSLLPCHTKNHHYIVFLIPSSVFLSLFLLTDRKIEAETKQRELSRKTDMKVSGGLPPMMVNYTETFTEGE